MNILGFLRKAAPTDLAFMMILATLAGLVNALLIAIVNRVAQQVVLGEGAQVGLGVTFAAAFAIYFFAQRAALLRANVTIERLLKELRLEIADGIRRSERVAVERLGLGQLYTLVAQETNHLSVVFPILVETFQQVVLLSVALLYLGYISKAALLVFVLAMAVGIAGYRSLDAELRTSMREVGIQQARMLDALGDLINGFKELRLNTRKSDSVYASVSEASTSSQAAHAAFGDGWVSTILIITAVMYSMLGVVSFVFPRYLVGHSLIVFKLTPVMLFSMGLVNKLIGVTPMVLKADHGLSSILDVARQLRAAGGISPERARELAPRFRAFQEISCAGVAFTHRDAEGHPLFSCGPVDLSIRRGELVFLVGGNGSGKSTLLRLITGLYPAERGTISVDGVALAGQDIGGFRELFSSVLADFHLFDRLYGVEQVDPLEVERLIDAMGLTGKVRFENGRFTDLQLSTGQRKRLALIAALLEDRPIYVFDEWSAEQDAYFRERFYVEILPGMKAKGKTVIVVTHDERFWHVADRVVKLDLGAIVWERAGAALGPDTKLEASQA